MIETQEDRRIKQAFVDARPEYTDKVNMITGYIDPVTGIVASSPIIGLEGTGLIWGYTENLRSSVPLIIGQGMRNYTGAAGVRCKTGLNVKGERVAREPVDDNQNAPINQQYHNAAQQAVYSQSKQFTPGLVTAYSAEVGGNYGLFVYVNPISYGGVVIKGALDVSALIPATTSETGVVVIYYDKSAAALGAVVGATSLRPVSSYALEDAVAVALGDTDRIRLGAVVLSNGQSTIVESDTFIDCRDWLTLETPASSSITVSDGTTTVTGIDTLHFTSGATVSSGGGTTADIAVSGGGGGGDYILIQDQESQNTAGGNFTSGAWRTRTLNTIVANVGSHASLSSNQITLAAGTYRVNASAPAYFVGRHQTRLYDITNSAVLVIGSSEFSTTAVSSASATRSIIQGRFTLAGSTVIEVQHQCETTNSAGKGLGVESNFTTEIYTSVELVRE